MATDLSFDSDKLLKSLEAIQQRYPFHQEMMQIALTHSEQAITDEEKAYDGTGSLFDFSTRTYKRNPADFVVFNRDFEDLYFYEVFKKVKEWSPQRIGRVRLMLRKPSSCYSMHSDESERYHIALTTNPECYFFFKMKGVYQIPANGQLYRFDATHMHTGLNAGKSDRIHLVFDTIDWCFKR